MSVGNVILLVKCGGTTIRNIKRRNNYQDQHSLKIMIKQIPLLLVVIGIAVLLIGVNLVLSYGLTFFSGISLFFGGAMLIAGIDLKRKIKKLNAKNQKDHHDYTISKLMEDEDTSKENDEKNDSYS